MATITKTKLQNLVKEANALLKQSKAIEAMQKETRRLERKTSSVMTNDEFNFCTDMYLAEDELANTLVALREISHNLRSASRAKLK